MWPSSGSLLIRDVEVQAAACRDRVDQGLQLGRRGRLRPCLPPALQRYPGGEPGAHGAPRPGPRAPDIEQGAGVVVAG